MRIMVTSSDGIATDRIRAYTEYRMFKSAARYGAIIRTIHVDFSRDGRDRDGVACTVLIDLVPSGQVKAQSRAAHPIAAIDKVCDRAGRLLSRRDTQSVSS
jgi:ribosome-associated translation inhibitor RaiA